MILSSRKVNIMNLNYIFFDEFKALDNLCRDIYGKTDDNKLGVTLYLLDMEKKASQGAFKVQEWLFDYDRLKDVRNKRNELAHSPYSFSKSFISQKDIDFVISFRKRILNQNDPLSLLRKKNAQARSISNVSTKKHISNQPQKSQPSGCLTIVATFLAILFCIITIIL